MPAFWLVQILLLVRLAKTLGLLMVNSYIITSTTTRRTVNAKRPKRRQTFTITSWNSFCYITIAREPILYDFPQCEKLTWNIRITLGKLAIHNPEASYFLALSPSCSPNIRRSFVMLGNPKKMQNNWTVSVRYYRRQKYFLLALGTTKRITHAE